MDTSDALLAAVLANPEDDVVRLVYADWLDEFGTDAEKVRSEFVRVQVELAKLPCSGKCKCDGTRHHESCPGSDLRRRERELFDTRHVRLSFDHFMSLVHRLARSRSSQVRLPHEPDDHYPDRYLLGTVHRGFVAQVRCTLADWCGDECHNCSLLSFSIHHGSAYSIHPVCQQCNGTGRTTGIGPEVVRRHPVERVVLTDREPDVEPEITGNLATWQSVDQNRPSWVPQEIIEELFKPSMDGPARGRTDRCHYDAATAKQQLSAALIAWAKSQPRPARIVATPVSVDFVTG